MPTFEVKVDGLATKIEVNAERFTQAEDWLVFHDADGSVAAFPTSRVMAVVTAKG